MTRTPTPARRFQGEVKEKILCGALIAVFILQLLPLLVIAQYDVPCADDFGFSYVARHALRADGNLGDVFQAACSAVRENYLSWQGSYAGIFLMVFQPDIFGDGWYSLTPLIVLLSLTASALFFFKALFGGCFGASREQWIMVALVWLTLFLQFLPSPAQGLYWYNGAIYYTFFFSATLVLAGCVLWLLQKWRGLRSVVCMVFACGLCAFIGGGNLITAFLSTLLLCLGTVFLLCKKDPRWKRLLPILAVMLAAFAANALAPGNTMRQSYINPSHPSAFSAILDSLACFMEYASGWLTVPALLLYALLCPALWKIAQNTASSVSFRYPGRMLLLSCGLAAAVFCPPMYALGGLGGYDRVTNVIYGVFLLVPLFNLFYFFGYIQRRLLKSEAKSVSPARYSLRLYAILILLLGFCSGVLYLSNFSNFNPTSVSAAISLLDGSAKQYHAEYRERLTVLNDDSIQAVVLPPYSTKPHVLFFDDGRNSDIYFQNQQMCKYFNKTSVIVDE